MISLFKSSGLCKSLLLWASSLKRVSGPLVLFIFFPSLNLSREEPCCSLHPLDNKLKHIHECGIAKVWLLSVKFQELIFLPLYYWILKCNQFLERVFHHFFSQLFFHRSPESSRRWFIRYYIYNHPQQAAVVRVMYISCELNLFAQSNATKRNTALADSNIKDCTVLSLSISRSS